MQKSPFAQESNRISKTDRKQIWWERKKSAEVLSSHGILWYWSGRQQQREKKKHALGWKNRIVSTQNSEWLCCVLCALYFKCYSIFTPLSIIKKQHAFFHATAIDQRRYSIFEHNALLFNLSSKDEFMKSLRFFFSSLRFSSTVFLFSESLFVNFGTEINSSLHLIFNAIKSSRPIFQCVGKWFSSVSCWVFAWMICIKAKICIFNQMLKKTELVWSAFSQMSPFAI